MPRHRRAQFFAALCLIGMTACVHVPSLDSTLQKASLIAQTSKIFASDGTLITTLHAEENRENIPLSQVPMVVRDAVVAIEDSRFYQHPGVDLRAIVRAFFRNTNSGKVVEGGSTITQQYVKNVLIARQRTLKRKIDEAVLAYELEKRYTKNQILERYLNTVYFGAGAYGIQAASHTYFSVDPKALNLPQAALLAGLIRSPSYYDPLSDPDASKARRNTVLQRMMDLGYITEAQRSSASATPLLLKPEPRQARYDAAYFVEWIKDVIARDPRFGKLGSTIADRVNALFKGGLRIYTTVDLNAQHAAEAASKQVLTDAADPYNALVSIEPDTGAVRAMVGGRDFFSTTDPYAKFNLAVQSRRQPGSSFKPFTLAAAIEHGISLDHVYRGGSQITIDLPDGTTWSPRNYESLSFGRYLTLREATIKSVNVVYAQVVRDIGPEAVIEMAHRLGITSDLADVYAIALGADEVSPLEMATAYCAFANGGYRVQANGITKITDSSGNVIWKWTPTKTQVLDPSVVTKVVDTLRDVVQYGTGTREQLTGRDVAGKTGTSEEYHDAWFAGFVPQMVTISWVGFPKAQIPMLPPYTRIRVVGGSWPGQIWKLTMLSELQGTPSIQFTTAATPTPTPMQALPTYSPSSASPSP
ncbi:MAG: transglycosylase domain-containing protein [Actinomycetota bacterium]